MGKNEVKMILWAAGAAGTSVIVISMMVGHYIGYRQGQMDAIDGAWTPDVRVYREQHGKK